MKICAWQSNHEISATVMQAVERGLNCDLRLAYEWNDELLQRYDAHIGYGILRNLDQIYHDCKRLGIPYFIIDNGYFKPGHYDGYYRVSLNGTQQTNLDIEPDWERWKALGIELKPWRGPDDSKPILVCPPTDPVRKFFNNCVVDCFRRNVVIRKKGDPSPLVFDDYNHVYTFNSSVGWQALIAGIPCISDPYHSIVGEYFDREEKIVLADISDLQYRDRERLFAIMSGLQLTLEEMRAGKLWDLINHLMSGSVLTPESR